MKRRLEGLLVGMTLLVLTGCAAPEVADAVRPGIPEGVEFEPLSEGPWVTWIEDGTRFAVVTLGSSSCPRVATALTVEDDEHLTLTFAASPNDPCTADLAPTTHEFDLPDAITTRPVTITIDYEDLSGTDTLTLE